MKRNVVIFTALLIITGFSAYTIWSAEPAQHSDLVLVPGGVFTLGGYDLPGTEPRKDPWPVAMISSFYIAVVPVTQKEYQEVTGINPSNVKHDDLPVDSVSWFEAIEYCNLLSRRDGLKPAYLVNGTDVTWDRDADGYRLPTEAEWEYACRAPNAYWAPEGHPWGLENIPGAYYEWCWDWYAVYPSGTLIDPDGAASGIHRILRGGPYYTSWDERATMRTHDYPNISGGLRFSFRLVRSSF